MTWLNEQLITEYINITEFLSASVDVSIQMSEFHARWIIEAMLIIFDKMTRGVGSLQSLLTKQ